jgi:hypothetical protein
MRRPWPIGGCCARTNDWLLELHTVQWRFVMTIRQNIKVQFRWRQSGSGGHRNNWREGIF